MHILFLTDNFPPEVNAPASRTHEHCRRWVSKGNRVTVITCAPNFPRGRVFEGYSNALWSREKMDGIDVIRVWSYITANEGFVRRVLDYVSFMFTGAIAGLLVRKVDIVVGTSPQFFTAVAAWFVGALKRRPFVFELRDLWPESIKAVGAMRDSVVLRALEKLELFLYRRARRIVSVTHSFRRTLAERGIDERKIDVVTNGVDTTRFSPRPKDPVLERELGFAGKFVAGYIGTHGMAHALHTLLEAAALLKSAGDDRFRLLLLGDGALKAELRQRAQEMQLDNVVFIDSVPKDQVARYWALLDASIIHLRRDPLFLTVIPSKIFESMGMGIPILHGVAGESAEIVRREEVGATFEPENATELVRELRRMEADAALRMRYRERCLRAARRYDRLELADAMLSSLQSETGVATA
jgi:glycosyltransferase involved in cell wall biosynthesis